MDEIKIYCKLMNLAKQIFFPCSRLGPKEILLLLALSFDSPSRSEKSSNLSRVNFEGNS